MCVCGGGGGRTTFGYVKKSLKGGYNCQICLTHCLRLATKACMYRSFPFIKLPLLIRPVLSYGGNQ